MSENNGRATVASDIVVPEEFVELRHLKTRSGGPVRVKVYPVGPLMAGRAGLALPGAIPEDIPADKLSDAMKAQQDNRNLSLMLDMAGPIIEDCTALSREDGTEVRPAFSFAAGTFPAGGTLPGRVLHAEDLSLLVATAMRLAGYGVEVADETSFRGEDRGGGGVGA